MAIDPGRELRRVMRVFPFLGYFAVPVLKAKDRMENSPMHRDLDAYSRKFLSEEQLSDAAFMRRLRRDVWYSALRYHCPVEEYFLYDFQHLSHAGRHEFVTECEKDAVCDALSTEAIRDVFTDKGKTFRKFAAHYGRDVLPVDETTDLDALRRFSEAHPRHIVKPRMGLGGQGVRIADHISPTEELLKVYREEPVILEELIEQDEIFARFHPTSVNTIRSATFHRDGETHILFTFLRMGQGSNIVDNGAAGGLIASVDTDTGIIITPGITENNGRAVFHPDTGVQILGTKLPRWDEMKQLSRELAASFPECPYVSWDLALTPKGWVVVEGNAYGQFVGPQITRQQGMRSELRRYLDIDP